MALDLKELADELDYLRDRRDDPDAESLDTDENKRLVELQDLEAELGDLHVASRNKGPFIADGKEWVDYCEQLAYDIGMCAESSPLTRYIDWKRWADDCRADYTSLEFDGETYYYED